MLTLDVNRPLEPIDPGPIPCPISSCVMQHLDAAGMQVSARNYVDRVVYPIVFDAA